MPIASIALLFVAFGLLLIATSFATRAGGSAPAGLPVAMAAMTGLALGFLALFFFAIPYVVFPLGIAAILITRWLATGQLTELGTFLAAGAGYWVLELGYARLSDLNDPAVFEPGWTPVPLAVASAVVVLGATLIVGQRVARCS